MYKRDNLSEDEQEEEAIQEEYEQKAKERILVMVFLLEARPDIYHKLMLALRMIFLKVMIYFR